MVCAENNDDHFNQASFRSRKPTSQNSEQPSRRSGPRSLFIGMMFSSWGWVPQSELIAG
jgi:hypothetical protein